MKKFFALLLVLVMVVFCFAACGEPENNDTGNNNGGGNTNGGGSGDGLVSESELPVIPIEPDLFD